MRAGTVVPATARRIPPDPMWGATLNEGRDRSPGDSCLILMLRWVLPPLNEGRDRSPGDRHGRG